MVRSTTKIQVADVAQPYYLPSRFHRPVPSRLGTWYYSANSPEILHPERFSPVRRTVRTVRPTDYFRSPGSGRLFGTTENCPVPGDHGRPLKIICHVRDRGPSKYVTPSKVQEKLVGIEKLSLTCPDSTRISGRESTVKSQGITSLSIFLLFLNKSERYG